MNHSLRQALPAATTTRFAPSPTGYLHLGHAHAALFAERAARAVGGRFLLRIEDIDFTRCRPEFEQAILDDLAWLGLAWETPVRRQSDHMADYRKALARLEAMDLLYPCFCTRNEIKAEIARSGDAPHGPLGAPYPGTCRLLDAATRMARMAEGGAYAIRIDMARAIRRLPGAPLAFHDRGRGWQVATPALAGDIVLARKETPTSYHLAVVVDDAAQGVTLVTRGDDLFPATHIHRLLQALLDLPVPDYHHHRLLTDRDNQRLAKRSGAESLRSLKEQGITPDTVRWMAGFPD